MRTNPGDFKRKRAEASETERVASAAVGARGVQLLGHENSAWPCSKGGSDTMAVCGKRNRPKLLLCLLGVTFAGYLLFFRHNSSEVRATNRRGAPVERDGDNEQLKRPVYEKPPLDLSAPGEMGRAVKLDLSEEEKIKEEESLKKHQINTYVSDRVSLHRRLPERWNPL